MLGLVMACLRYVYTIYSIPNIYVRQHINREATHIGFTYIVSIET